MSLRLPSYQQLSKEQDEINNLPLKGRRLVIGPPGTGKTVMALYRSSMFEKQGRDSKFFVYNKTLRFYLDQAIRETKLSGTADGFHQWFTGWYRKTFRKRAPQTKPYVFDWDAVMQDILLSDGKFPKFDHLAIDEGQDLPRDFYSVAKMISENLTVFADENQMLTDSQSTLKELTSILRPDGIHQLTRNYRNTLEIARFSSNFYVGLTSGIPEFPVRRGAKPLLIQRRSVEKQIDFIRTYEKNFSDADIGVLLYRKRDVQKFVRALTGGTQNPVQWYLSGDDSEKIDFGKRGVKVLTYASSKGLEFDTVILPLLDRIPMDGTMDEAWKMRFFVLTSRPKDTLIMLHASDDIPAVLRNITVDQYEARG